MAAAAGRHEPSGGPGGPRPATPTLPTKGTATDSSAPGPSLTVAAVARRLGVAPATLRTWDRRYGLGPSQHLAGSHRRYSSSDVSRLLVMRRLTLEGVAPSDAARTALESQPTGVDGAPGASGEPRAAAVVDAFADAGPMAPDPPGLVAAAVHFDNAAVRWMLARVHPGDVVAWWTQLVQPALDALEDEVAVAGPGESAGPALTSAAYAELRSRAAVTASRTPLGADAAGPTILAVGCVPGAELLVHVLATALQEHGVRARVLSVGRPEAVTEAIAQVRPEAVLLHIHADEDGTTAGPSVEAVSAAVEAGAGLATRTGSRSEMPVFVHLEGAGRIALPAGADVHRVRTLTGALHEILAVVR
ncbi:MerR family transcriptional regulator [Actinotalea sp. BY-33]|uniref:MerR family transcriptional regulator n=1 Tax=Actinotalea soli TaxID=2819234 RepID=A0A939LQT4_9CELL|nr:MerR family transcriptional regulator [Actinotalea soli]MBO1752293.1 MerR family transcriptional regulator [Actinotalea soli]